MPLTKRNARIVSRSPADRTSNSLMHLYNNLDLTFAEIKDVIEKATAGRLERVTEKLDGSNLKFTWNESLGEIRVARKSKDIIDGGLSIDDLSEKYRGYDKVRFAFVGAFRILTGALGVLSDSQRREIFKEGRRWFSTEIIYPNSDHTVNYDGNHVVFHKSPVFEYKQNEVIVVDGDDYVDRLAENVNKMQAAIQNKRWQIHGPLIVAMSDLTSCRLAERITARLDELMLEAGVDDSGTIRDFVRGMADNKARELNLDEGLTMLLGARLAGVKGAPNIISLRKSCKSEKNVRQVEELVSKSPTLRQSFIRPLELLIHDLATEVLRGLQPALPANVQDIKQRLPVAIDRLKEVKDLQEHLQRQLEKLGSVKDMIPMEGVVFFYKGTPYKFTGQFAPANQIMNLFRRGVEKYGVNPSLPGSLLEGGRAFNDVGSISIEVLNAEWLGILEVLRSFGADDIRPVGTTFKKPEMGDIDVTASHPEGREGLLSFAQELYGKENVRRIGGNIVSFAYPLKSGCKVQVDVMVGDPNLISWSRFGPSNQQEHPNYSQFKGTVRQLLVSAILRNLSKKDFPGRQTEFDRERYSFDIDNGLFKVVQTRRGAVKKSGEHRVLKQWKTLNKDLVSKDPDEIVGILFGEGPRALDVLTFEDVLRELQGSTMLADDYDEIIDSFIEDLETTIKISPFRLAKSEGAAMAVLEKAKSILEIT